MAITPLPQPPTRANPAGFSEAADTFLSALPVFANEANALQTDVNAKQVTASDAAIAAEASRVATEAASNVTAWVSGTTYAVGNVRYSPINFFSYRRKTAGAGTTDPSLDPTNWAQLVFKADVIPSAGANLISGQVYVATTGFTLNTGLTPGNTYVIYNNSAAVITLTQGSGLTLRLAASTVTGSRTLAARGMVTVWCLSTTEYIISGAGVS